MSTDPKIRKAIAQRPIDRAKARGPPIDKDPIFIALLDEWICGGVDMKTVRARYLDSLALKEQEPRDRLLDKAEISSDGDK